MHLNGTPLKRQSRKAFQGDGTGRDGVRRCLVELLRQEMYFFNVPTLLVLSLCPEHRSG